MLALVNASVRVVRCWRFEVERVGEESLPALESLGQQIAAKGLGGSPWPEQIFLATDLPFKPAFLRSGLHRVEKKSRVHLLGSGLELLAFDAFDEVDL